jgi:hypothetical protein
MAEVDAQTIRDATEAKIEAEDAKETAQEAKWDAELARSQHEQVLQRMGALEERVVDTEAVTMGIVAYLAEEEEPEPEPEHTEVEQRPESKPEDREPEPGSGEHHGCGSVW